MKNVLWSLGNALLSKGFSFVFTIIIGNLLLPEQLGLFVTLLLVVTYAANIFSLNLGGGLVQKMNSQGVSQDPGRFFSAGLLATAFLSITALVVFYLLSDSLIHLFDIPRARSVIQMTYPLLVLTMFRSYFTHVYQAELRFKPLTLINMLAAGVQIVVTLLLLSLGMSLKGVFWGLYSSSLVALIPLSYQCFRRFGMVVKRQTFHHLKELTAFSSIIFVGSIAVLLDQRIDMIFVAHFLDNQDVAVYDYVLKFALLFVLFGASISKVTYPRFTRAFSSPSHDISRIFNFSLNYTFFFLSILALIFFLHAEWIIGMLLPDFYLQLIPYLLILLIGVIPKSVVTSVGTL
ncbi:MAG TPA: oligosaccharide flippase family protein, partial [Bacteroidales bacterium]|nr:oligosaccharide flippase family protein [Bacteroidales bacterium]